MECDDQGTADDASDDIFVYTILVDGINATDKSAVDDQTRFTLIINAKENVSLANTLKLRSNVPSQAYDRDLQVYNFEL